MSVLAYEPEILAYREHGPYFKSFSIVLKFEAQDLMQLNTHTHAHTCMHIGGTCYVIRNILKVLSS